MRYEKCPHCNGTGKLEDQREVGANMRKLRIGSKLSLRRVATLMGFSAPYVSDLERGRRGWNDDTKARYKLACKG